MRIIRVAILCAILPLGCVGETTTHAVTIPVAQDIAPELDYSANELVSWCDEDNTYYDWRQCFAYIRGFWEGVLIQYNFAESVIPNAKSRILTFCASGRVTLGQMHKVFLRYAEKNPQALHKHTAFFLFAAFIDAFPCTNN